MKWNSSLLLIILISWMSVIAQAQNGSEEILLSEFLKSVEDRFQITFSFADENIEGIKISLPDPNLTLEQLLTFLENQTNLEFEQVDENFITIIKPKTGWIICGNIIDAESSEGVPGATVNGRNSYSISDKDGSFRIKVGEQNELITIQSMGYHPISRSARSLIDKPCQTFRLRPKILELQEVVIQNYLTQGINKQLTGSFQIRPDELGILPGLIEQDVLETVQALPGIISVNEKVADINVRAGTNDQNLVLWDGVRMYQYGHFFGLISAFNPYLTNDVILSKNGTSASLGEGVSSTIEIHSNDDVVDKISGGAGINFINGDVFLKVPLSKKLSTQLSARRSIADIIETPTYQMYYDRTFRGTEVISSPRGIEDELINTNQNFVFYDFNVKFLYDLSPKDKFRLNFIHFNNDLEFRENAIINDTSIYKTSSLSQKNLAVGMSYTRQWSDKFRSYLLGYYTSYDLHAVNHDLYNDQRLIQENEVIDNGLKAEISHAIKDNLQLNSGYQFLEVGIGNLEDINNPVFYRYIKRVLRTHSVYSEMEVNSASNRTNVRGGVRVNYFEKFDEFSVEPRFSLNHRFYGNFSAELLGEIKSQTATQVIDLQNDFLGVENRKWVLANTEDIPIMKSRQLSVGINFDNQGFLFSIDGFYKYIEGIITSSQGFQNQLQYERHSGSYDSYGVDVLVSKEINKFNSWLSYSYSKNNYSFPDVIPPEFPSNLDITHSANLAASYQVKNLEVSSGIKWHTGIPYSRPVPGEEIENGAINYDTPNNQRLEDYLRLDLSAKYGIELNNDTRLYLGVSLWNLLNSKNVINQYYRIDDNNELVEVKQHSLGLTPNVSVRVHF